MFWSKEINDKSALFVTRSFLVLLYFSIAVEFISGQSSVSFALAEFRSVGMFFLAAAAFTALPFVDKIIKIQACCIGEASVALVLASFVSLCIYSFIVFGSSENTAYIFLTFMACVLTQLPVAYILKKNSHEKQ